MKEILLPLAAALCAAGLAAAADNAVPPPPPASPATPAASGAAGKLAAGEHRHPILGLLKQVEEKGKITREEFLAHARKQAEEMFSKLDKNGDGVIDKAEVAEIEAQLKNVREKIQERAKGSGTPRRRPGAEEKKPAN